MDSISWALHSGLLLMSNDDFVYQFCPYTLLGSKDLGSYVFRTLMCIVGKLWSKQDV